MDHLLRIKELLRWNDSGEPSRILRPEHVRAVSQVGQYCAGCQVELIRDGDLIVRTETGWKRVNCE